MRIEFGVWSEEFGVMSAKLCYSLHTPNSKLHTEKPNHSRESGL